MKIDSLYVAGFLGVTNVEIQTARPLQMFTGPNGAGKSSLRDSIAFALTADLCRVSLKKEAAQLVHTGLSGACCEVRTADGDVFGVTISGSGAIKDSQKGRDTDPVLPFVLDAQRLARLTDTERRAFLFNLMGVSLGQPEIAARLKEAGCDESKVARVLPLLRAGFDAACTEAKSQATSAKGAWKAVTGEAYGQVKGASWAAPAVEFSQPVLDAALKKLAATDAGVSAAQQRVGGLEADHARAIESRTKLAEAQVLVSELVRRKVKLQHDEMALAEAQRTLDAAAQRAGSTPLVGLVHDFARAVASVLPAWPTAEQASAGWDELRALLDAYESEFGPVNGQTGDLEEQARLPALTQARDLMATAVRTSMRDLKAAEEAQAVATMLEQQIANSASVSVELQAARKHLDDLQAERKTNAAAVDHLRAKKAAADGAAKKTEDAAKYHGDVVAWDAIAEQLSPNGIPGKLLAEALGPINERLAQSAVDAEWPAVKITADMAITAGDRPYPLLSESEQWRTDAMLAEAVANTSGARLLVLDRFDVLDMQGRADLIAWLDVLADNQEIDTCLLFGTLKSLPSGLPSTFDAHWIQDGAIGQLKEAA